MKLYTTLYNIGTLRSKKAIVNKYGLSVYKEFKSSSKVIQKNVISHTPDIGNTIFSFNYAFTPAYIAWYKAMGLIGLTETEKQELMWIINEKIITVIPKFFATSFVNSYLNNFRKKAPLHEKLIKEGRVRDYDYLLSFNNVSENCFEINITKCGMKTLAADFDALGIFPTVCRVDYMMSNYMNAGFERTKTLGDGDDCCNCRYIIGGTCDWSPEKGFTDRK